MTQLVIPALVDMTRSVRLLGFTLAGMILGVILMHPFAMMAYTLGPQHPHGSLDIFIWGREAWGAFEGGMVAMAVAFALMGGVAGCSLGVWSIQRERLAASQLESQRRQVALETLQELMVTLAHHIRNANLVIGGFSSRMIKHLPDPEVQRQLKMIQRASREIEAVIASLESLSQIDRTKYIGEWETRMIDLKQELEARLAVLESAKEVL